MSLLLSTFDLRKVMSCIWFNVIICSLWEYKIMRRQFYIVLVTFAYCLVEDSALVSN